MIRFLVLWCLIFLGFLALCEEEFCYAGDRKNSCNDDNKYIFYDVNPPEGFNLRRDVYLRMAVFVRKLRKENWYLVLPPWPHLYHWLSESLPNQSRLPWRLFFNLTALSAFAPVIEMDTFLENKITQIDQVFVLQHFESMFKTGNFEDKMKIEPCEGKIPYKKTSNGYTGYFWNYNNLTAKTVNCLSFHGPASQLSNILKETEAKTIMFDHVEVALHDRFGDKTYWDARRSMKFADHLIEVANKYRLKKLNSTDELDLTKWENRRRSAVGGNYICVHLRRRDFIRGRHKEVPSIKGAAAQIKVALEKENLKTVFIATDATKSEKMELRSYLLDYKVLTYNPSKDVKTKYKDGGVAIIEQIICSHARKFIGTHESTFSFRIQEEREIMGFQPETTFNRLCGDSELKCKPPSKWLIV